MADEATITPDKEVKDVKEGTMAAELAKETPKESAEAILPAKEPETVPLPVYLSLKDDIKELKKELKEAKDSKKPSVIIDGLKDLASKYPDVNQEFLQDLLTSATSTAQQEIEKKYTPILMKQDEEKKQAAFDKAFDNLWDKTLQENPELPKDMDKDAIKTLALTPKYRNTPLVDILTRMYKPVDSGKGSSENEMRSGADHVDDVVNFDKITSEQRTRIMADPKTRQKYFDWLDKNGK